MAQESEYATLNANAPNTCIVCYKNVDIFSIGMCEHPVCFECSTRMRVLCQQNECPICRQDLPKVVFTREIKPFRHLRKGNLFDSKYNIYFEDEIVMEKFNSLLAHTCNICKNNDDYGNFTGLKNHMRSKHELHYCDLCVENLRIFSRERRCYSRQDLARHRREGDTDDKSHKGHPLCKFCDTRYMDNDELYRHLRRDHLYCHFCDADGYHRYYCSYPDLRDHFRDEHYLCEEGACVGEQFTSVFRSDIDLKAHKANVHLRQLGKAAAKQARTLELEFTLSPRGDRGSRRNDRGPGRSYHNQELVEYPAPEPPAEITFAKQPQVDVQSTEQFPTLGNTAPIIPVISHGKTRGNLTIRSRLGQPMITDEDFPALAGPEAPSCSGMSNTLNVSVSQAQPNSGPSNVSIHVNHKSNGTVTTRVSGNNIRIRPTRADFPALGSSEPLTMAPNVGQWTKVTAKIKPKEIEHRTRNSAVISTPSIQSGSDFPCLKPKSNRSSVSIVPSQSNFATNSNDPTKGKTKKKKNTKSGNNEVKKVEVAKSHETSDSKKNDKKKTKSAEENPEVTLANSNNVQRKRSEIKIEGLASTNNNVVMRSEDFPALGNPKASPPGLAKPPPGFGAPPGFSSKQVNDNRLTFTNSSGESYAIVPNESHSRQYVYTPPTDFQRRNKNLVASVNEALDNEESIKEFRYLSGLFRQGVCDPQEFYIRCRTSMGISTFEKIFPELLLLLPDIEKQRELFSIHKTESSGKARGLEECTTCGQIVRGSELKSHKSCHDLEKHFPALDIGAQSNSWARK